MHAGPASDRSTVARVLTDATPLAHPSQSCAGVCSSQFSMLPSARTIASRTAPEDIHSRTADRCVVHARRNRAEGTVTMDEPRGGEPAGITLTSEITVRLVQSMGGDHMVVAAARVSTSGGGRAGLGRPGESGGIGRPDPLPAAPPPRHPVRAQFADLLRSRADLRLPRVAQASHHVIQRRKWTL